MTEVKLKPEEELSLGIKIASEVHLHQVDKGGKPYILHPLFLMNQLLFDTQLATIAVMHDVIEDSNGTVTIESLRDLGFSDRVLDALSLLTHDPSDDYLTVYIPTVCTNYDAVRVKRKDIDHNGRMTRLKLSRGVGVDSLRRKDFERMEKYAKAFVMLGLAKRKFQHQ